MRKKAVLNGAGIGAVVGVISAIAYVFATKLLVLLVFNTFSEELTSTSSTWILYLKIMRSLDHLVVSLLGVFVLSIIICAIFAITGAIFGFIFTVFQKSKTVYVRTCIMLCILISTLFLLTFTSGIKIRHLMVHIDVIIPFSMVFVIPILIYISSGTFLSKILYDYFEPLRNTNASSS